MIWPGIRKSPEAMQALCVSFTFAEHSFCDIPHNTQCSNTVFKRNSRLIHNVHVQLALSRVSNVFI